MQQRSEILIHKAPTSCTYTDQTTLAYNSPEICSLINFLFPSSNFRSVILTFWKFAQLAQSVLLLIRIPCVVCVITIPWNVLSYFGVSRLWLDMFPRSFWFTLATVATACHKNVFALSVPSACFFDSLGYQSVVRFTEFPFHIGWQTRRL